MTPKNAIRPAPEVPPSESELPLREAIESMQEAFAYFDADDCLVYCNDQYRQLHRLGPNFIKPGVRFEDIIRTNIEKGNVADAIGREEEHIRDRLERHRNPKGPIYRRLTDGSSFIINESRTPNGGTCLTMTEVTELAQIEEELRESRERFQALADNLPEFISMKDTEGRFQFVNKRFEEWIGVNREDVIGKTVHDLYSKEQADEFHARDREAIKSGSIKSWEIDLLYPDGKTRPIISTRFPITSSAGEVIGLGTINYDLTERKEVGEALRESEERYRDLTHGSVMGIVIDRMGKPLFANQAYADLFGYDGPDDILALEKLDPLYAPEDLPRIKKYRKNRLKGKEAPELYEFGGIRKDGSEIRLESRFRVITWEGKQAIQSTLIDLTERRKLEDRAKAEQTLLMDAIESIEGGAVLFDAEDRFVLCNSTYKENLKPIKKYLKPGVSYEEILRAYAEKGLNTEAKENAEKYVRERLKRHRKLEPSMVQIVKTGQWFMLREYRMSDGGILLVRTDVTDRKEAEEALRESEQRLKTIIDTVPAIITVKDTEFRYLLSNQYHKELFGLEGKDIIGKTPDILGKEHGDNMKRLESQVIETGEGIPYYDYSITNSKGKKLDLMVTKAPLRDLSGKIIGTVTSGIDISDFRHAERELAHHNKMESLGYLAGGMAHNLNNMLQPILTLGELTRGNLPKDSPDYQNLDIICQAGHRARDLVKRISVFSRQQEMNRQNVDMYEIVREGLSLVQSMIPSNITIKESLEKNSGQVFGDPAQIQTVILNLVANAVDAMEGETGDLTVSLSQAFVDDSPANSVPGLDKGNYAKLTIADQGLGMDEDTLNQIFDPFFTTKEPDKGTGLGLSSAFGTIYKHGGTIRASSSPDAGTVFDVYLPLQHKPSA